MTTVNTPAILAISNKQRHLVAENMERLMYFTASPLLTHLPDSPPLDSIQRTTRLHGKQSFELTAVERCRTKVQRGLECDMGLSHSAASAVILQNREAHLDSSLRKRPRHPGLRGP